MDQNWSHEEVRRAVLTALVVEKKPSVSLDMSRADCHNVQDAVRWIQEMGYDARADDSSESVTASARVKISPSAKAGDADQVERQAIDLKNQLLDAWLERPDDAFEKEIRRTMQDVARAKRAVDFASPTAKSGYWLGYVAGAEDVLEALFRERLRRKSIMAAIDADIEDAARRKGPSVNDVLFFLYGKGQPVRHPEMAEGLGVSYEALAEAMKPVLACYAAQAYRTGRNTRYELTPVAKRLCRELYREEQE